MVSSTRTCGIIITFECRQKVPLPTEHQTKQSHHHTDILQDQPFLSSMVSTSQSPDKIVQSPLTILTLGQRNTRLHFVRTHVDRWSDRLCTDRIDPQHCRWTDCRSFGTNERDTSPLIHQTRFWLTPVVHSMAWEAYASPRNNPTASSSPCLPRLCSPAAVFLAPSRLASHCLQDLVSSPSRAWSSMVVLS